MLSSQNTLLLLFINFFSSASFAVWVPYIILADFLDSRPNSQQKIAAASFFWFLFIVVSLWKNALNYR